MKYYYYYDNNAIYVWSSQKQRFYRSNTGWEDDYVKIIDKYNGTRKSEMDKELKKAFANYF